MFNFTSEKIMALTTMVYNTFVQGYVIINIIHVYSRIFIYLYCNAYIYIYVATYININV